MKFKRCHVKWDSHTAAAVKDAVGDEKGYPSTNNYKHFTVLDATVKAQPEGLLLIQGTLDLFQTWWGIFDDTPPPEGWPSNEVLRDWWNPLRYIQGPTYKAPYRGHRVIGQKDICIAIPSCTVAGNLGEPNVPLHD